MADKKNQHFVPQYYFKFFSDKRKFISLIRLMDGKFIETASIKDQASKSYFYGDKAVEDAIEAMETIFLPPLRKLKEEKSFWALSDDEVIVVLQSIIFQRSRTQAARLDLEPAGQELANMFLEIAVNNNEQFSDEERSEILKSFTAKPNMEELQKIQMIESVKSANFMTDLGMAILKNRTNRNLIFGDAPVVMFNYFQKNITDRGVLGMRNPGLQIYYPLNSRSAVFLYDRNAYKVSTNKHDQIEIREKSDIDKLNMLQIHNAGSAVYLSSPTDKDYISQLWTTSRRTTFNVKGRHRNFTVNHDGEEKHIYHQYEKQLSFVPDLSFCPCPLLATSDLLVDRSTWDGRRYVPEQRQWSFPETKLRTASSTDN
ncbi:DUF4238 domain-containing protein [Pseudomonas sp. LB3P81]